MRRTFLVSSILLIATTLLPTAHAQNQPANSSPASSDQSPPVDVVREKLPAPGNTSDLTADYPLDRAGVFIQGSQWTEVTSQMPAKTKNAHGLAASLSYGIVPVKVVAEYEGEHASAQVEAGRPIICLCHFTSIPGAPVLVRLHPKREARELDGGRMVVYPVVGGSKMVDANKTDLISADVSHPDPQVWLIRPQSPLEPGEYALMLGTQNIAIFPFTVAAPAVHPSGAN
jgi:hypothetical protein